MPLLVPIILALFLSGPALAVGFNPDQDWNEEEQISREDRRNSKELLYDQIAADAIIDGHLSEVAHACLNFEMRFRRSDGKMVVRRVGYCE